MSGQLESSLVRDESVEWHVQAKSKRIPRRAVPSIGSLSTRKMVARAHENEEHHQMTVAAANASRGLSVPKDRGRDNAGHHHDGDHEPRHCKSSDLMVSKANQIVSLILLQSWVMNKWRKRTWIWSILPRWLPKTRMNK